MLLNKIFEAQTKVKRVNVFHWLLFMNTDVTLTIDIIQVYFHDFLDEFHKKFKVENGVCKISISDMPKIKIIDQDSFIIIKQQFIKSIRAKNLDLKHFYDLFKVGVQLLDTTIVELYCKSKSTKEKEDYFQKQLSEFFFKIFPKNVSFDAYLKSKKHSDCIMFNKTSENYEDLVFIEYAADIEIGNLEDTDTTILGHLNKISNEYFKKKIDFFHNTNHPKSSIKTLDNYASKVWFIYFEENLKSKSIIQAITKNFFEKINIVLVNYDFIQSKHLIIHYKMHDKENFTEEKLY